MSEVAMLSNFSGVKKCSSEKCAQLQLKMKLEVDVLNCYSEGEISNFNQPFALSPEEASGTLLLQMDCLIELTVETTE